MGDSLRWGILGSAGIARKNWKAIRNSGNGVVAAVASRDVAKAAEFIDELQEKSPFAESPRAVAGYEGLVTADDVDAVYVPIPTGLRKEWVIRAAEAGKHVMCEKPCAADTAELEAMTTACAANGVQFMDGVMFMHCDRLPRIREALDAPGNIGEVRHIASAFTFPGTPGFFVDNIRLHSDLEPAGVLGDLGWYTIRIALFVMNYEMPQSVRTTILADAGRSDSPRSVPTELRVELSFASGASSTFYNSFRTGFQQWLHVSGSLGWLRVDDFILPVPGTRPGFSVSNPEFAELGGGANASGTEPADEPDPAANAQETQLFRNFAKLALGGVPDPFWPEVSLKTQRVLDACLQSARNGGATVEP